MIENSQSKWVMKTIQVWLVGASAILLFTGMAKLLTAISDAKFLGLPDPLFTFLPNRQFLLRGGSVEFIVAISALKHADDRIKVGLIVWVSTLFLAYRIGLWLVGFKGNCSCIGNYGDLLRLTPKQADALAKMLLAYLLLPGCYFLLRKTSLPTVLAEPAATS